jgi:hypothetical protein
MSQSMLEEIRRNSGLRMDFSQARREANLVQANPEPQTQATQTPSDIETQIQNVLNEMTYRGIHISQEYTDLIRHTLSNQLNLNSSHEEIVQAAALELSRQLEISSMRQGPSLPEHQGRISDSTILDLLFESHPQLLELHGGPEPQVGLTVNNLRQLATIFNELGISCIFSVHSDLQGPRVELQLTPARETLECPTTISGWTSTFDGCVHLRLRYRRS